jgi:hypothetical protein
VDSAELLLLKIMGVMQRRNRNSEKLFDAEDTLRKSAGMKFVLTAERKPAFS